MSQDNGQEKTEQASQKKLDDVREKGQVAKSLELNSLIIYSSGIILLYLAIDVLTGRISRLSVNVFSSLDSFLRNLSLKGPVEDELIGIAVVIFLMFSGLFIMAGAVNIAQVGLRFTPKALYPKFSKFNPIKGLKRMFFSSHSALELAKSLTKLFIIGISVYFILYDFIAGSFELLNMQTDSILGYMKDSTLELTWKTAIVFSVIAAADFLYQRFKFKKDMMMTKQEVKEEAKQSEGDPLIKSRIRKIQFQISRNRFVTEVPKADVIITNPTHYAIAVKYDMKKDSAPKVLAKGVDEAAQKIKEIAEKNNIPLHEDRELARALYKLCNPGDHIPESLFRAVAQVLAYVYQLRTAKRKSII